jgi:hypothetical protein
VLGLALVLGRMSVLMTMTMPRLMSMLQLGVVLGARSKPKPADYVAAREHVATWSGGRLQVEADA